MLKIPFRVFSSPLYYKGFWVLRLTLSAEAAVIAVGPGALAGTPPITFAGLADGTEVNGLVLGGVTFSYSLGSGLVFIDGGPGVTNNVTPPNIFSVGTSSGVLTLILPGFFDAFGEGYALLNTVAITNAATITLFSDATNIGSLSYNAVPDPVFAGGFAGIQSTIPFNRVALSFNSAAAPGFAIDNIRLVASEIPEPSSMLLLLSGMAGLLCVNWRTTNRGK